MQSETIFIIISCLIIKTNDTFYVNYYLNPKDNFAKHPLSSLDNVSTSHPDESVMAGDFHAVDAEDMKVPFAEKNTVKNNDIRVLRQSFGNGTQSLRIAWHSRISKDLTSSSIWWAYKKFSRVD